VWDSFFKGERVKGTKLWQAAGSPIIQGRSRRQRPAWQQWVPAWALAAALVGAILYIAPGVAGGSRWAPLGDVVGALVGAVIGVEVTRAMGWRFPLIWGAIVGIAASVVGIAVAAAVFSA